MRKLDPARGYSKFACAWLTDYIGECFIQLQYVNYTEESVIEFPVTISHNQKRA
jgi:hypothetical protein